MFAAVRRAILVLLALPGLAFAQASETAESTALREPRFVLTPHVGILFGGTSYTFGIAIQNLTARSELNWSLDTVTAGADASLRFSTRGGRRLSLDLSFAAGVTDPFGTMLDQDWIGNGVQEVEFSHTDSSVRGRIFLFDLAFRIALEKIHAPNGALTLDLLIGHHHELFLLEAWGADGWQLDGSGQRRTGMLDPNTRALRYETQKLLSYLGLGVRGRLSETFYLDTQAALGVAISLDDDDHVLRNKRGLATSIGMGAILRVAPRWILFGARGRTSGALGFDLALRYLRAWGTLVQRYYADDPSISGDQTTVAIPNTDLVITSLTGSARAAFEIAF